MLNYYSSSSPAKRRYNIFTIKATGKRYMKVKECIASITKEENLELFGGKWSPLYRTMT